MSFYLSEYQWASKGLVRYIFFILAFAQALPLLNNCSYIIKGWNAPDIQQRDLLLRKFMLHDMQIQIFRRFIFTNNIHFGCILVQILFPISFNIILLALGQPLGIFFRGNASIVLSLIEIMVTLTCNICLSYVLHNRIFNIDDLIQLDLILKTKWYFSF